VLSDEQLRSMSSDQRRGLIRELVSLEDSVLGGRPQDSLRRKLALALIVVCCIGLAAWIAVLALTLPRYYRTGGWRGAWVGLDIAELAAFAAAGWAAWRRRQVLVICLVILATLLCCDAWFDVVLDAHTKDFLWAVLSAVLVELPLAALAMAGALRLIRQTIRRIRLLEGDAGPMPPLWKVPLLGAGPDVPLHHLFTVSDHDDQADAERQEPDQRSAASG
jgi:hypothetical protein